MVPGASATRDNSTGYTCAVPAAVYVTIWLGFGFLLGSIPFGWVAARLGGIDIRKIGSGNIGATNVARARGWGWGAAVLLLDMLKGLLPLLALRACLANLPAGQFPPQNVPWLVMAVGVASILGHAFTPWLGFRGGKGAATGAGVMIAVMGWWALAPLACFLLIVATLRYVSLGSLFTAALIAAVILTVPALRPYWPLGIAGALIVFWTHRTNIERLLAGTENRLGASQAQPEPEIAAGPDQPEDS